MEKDESTKERRPVQEVFEKVWSQALLAVSTAEEEATKVVGRLAEAAGWSPEEVKRQAREFTDRLASQRRELERGVEEGVRRTLLRLRVPRREELQALSARLEEISRRVEALREQR